MQVLEIISCKGRMETIQIKLPQKCGERHTSNDPNPDFTCCIAGMECQNLGGGFKYMFTPTWGNDPI